jgi:hypothetical protein
MNTILVKIDNEFLLQHRMCCLLEPQRYREDVVTVVLFILNNNTSATGVHIPNFVFLWNIGS